MKRLLLLTALAVFSLVNTNAQCVPDTSLAPGVYPDSATNFFPAYVGQPYEQIVHASVPADTCIVVVNPPCQDVPFEYVEVVSITGLPPNFTYDCVPADCKMPGDSAGCVRIYSSSNPIMADTGRYDLVIELDAVVNIGGFPVSNPTTVDYYFIQVNPPQGIADFAEISGLKVWPNPANRYVDVSFSTEANQLARITLTDLIGKKVMTRQLNTGSGQVYESFDISGLTSGLYLYTVECNGHRVTRKLIVE